MWRLGAVLMILAVVVSAWTGHTGAARLPTYTVHGGSMVARPIMCMEIRSTVSLVLHFTARKGLPPGKPAFWSIAVQPAGDKQSFWGMVTVMGSGENYGGSPPVTGIAAYVTPFECSPGCLVLLDSADIDWSLSVTPPSAVIKFSDAATIARK